MGHRPTHGTQGAVASHAPLSLVRNWSVDGAGGHEIDEGSMRHLSGHNGFLMEGFLKHNTCVNI